MDTSKQRFKLIIGLGNPDAKYANTYHNAGHLFVDYLDSRMLNVECRILKSDVYMNESGSFVKKEMKKSGAKPEELLIVHDDSDIEIGNYKLSFDRGAAGHHGIESIQTALKTNDFWRLRIGIRPKPKADLPAAAHRARAGEFVLKKINSANKKLIERAFDKIQTELNLES